MDQLGPDKKVIIGLAVIGICMSFIFVLRKLYYKFKYFCENFDDRYIIIGGVVISHIGLIIVALVIMITLISYIRSSFL